MALDLGRARLVEDHVRVQVLLRRESSVAELANEGAWLGVSQHVLMQSVFGGEGLAADFAREEEFIGSAVVRVVGVASAGSDAAAGAAAAVIVRMRCG